MVGCSFGVPATCLRICLSPPPPSPSSPPSSQTFHPAVLLFFLDEEVSCDSRMCLNQPQDHMHERVAGQNVDVPFPLLPQEHIHERIAKQTVGVSVTSFKLEIAAVVRSASRNESRSRVRISLCLRSRSSSAEVARKEYQITHASSYERRSGVWHGTLPWVGHGQHVFCQDFCV